MCVNNIDTKNLFSYTVFSVFEHDDQFLANKLLSAKIAVFVTTNLKSRPQFGGGESNCWPDRLQ